MDFQTSPPARHSNIVSPCFSSNHHSGRPHGITPSSAQTLRSQGTALQTCARRALEPGESRGLTWDTRLSTFQPWASSSHFMGPSLAQRPHGELEGAARHWLPSVFDIHSVDPHFLRHKADAVGVFVSFYDFGIKVSSRGASYLGCQIPTINF